jgi:hypothetical protein
MIVKALIFVGGVATGLIIAKYYARAQVGGVLHDILEKVGLEGGVIEETAQKIIPPLVA